MIDEKRRLNDYPLHLRLEWYVSRSKVARALLHYGWVAPRRWAHRFFWKRWFRRTPSALAHHGAHFFSQKGEDGMILEIFRRIGEGGKYAVEFGISSGEECCTRNLFANHGWRGLGMDGGAEAIEKARQIFAGLPVRVGQHFITRENIVPLLRQYDVPEEPDLFVIDIDGNDYWVLAAALAHYRPRVIVAEYNARWTPPTEWVMTYCPDHYWDWTWYSGASLTSLAKLCQAHGYSLVGCDECGVNAFFVRDDQLQGRFPDASFGARYHYVPPAYWHLPRPRDEG